MNAKKNPIITLAVVLLCVTFTLSLTEALTEGSSPEEKHPLTVAESSDYTATSRYADVVSFIRELQSMSAYLKVETMCTSPEGRAVPLLIIGNPLPSSPQDLHYDQRTVVYIQANIHAGEVEGKEASLMLARDILLAEKMPYLDNLVILISPIFNADGNEPITPENRRNQVGPEQGVGVRYNGQNLDLNRDGMKMESPEIQGLVENILNRWDPSLLVDCHTTNGSYHQQPVTYAWILNPNGENSLIDYMRDKMMPEIDATLEKKYGYLSIPYGNFRNFKDPEAWMPSGPEPRYITNYIGLRNRLAILIENYAYADYKTRVEGNYYFLHSILEFCSANQDTINSLIAEADRKTILRGIGPAPSDTFIMEYDVRALDEPISILGWEMEAMQSDRGYPRLRKTDREKTYVLPYISDFFAKRSIQFPYGYFLTVPDQNIINNLLHHGIAVEKLLVPITLEVESFHPTEITHSDRLYQGHHMNSIKGEYKIEEKEFPAGTYFIGTAQRLANVAAYLLEAESDDGLVVWNFFDRYLVPQWSRELPPYPVYRLLKPTPLVKEIIN